VFRISNSGSFKSQIIFVSVRVREDSKTELEIRALRDSRIVEYQLRDSRRVALCYRAGMSWERAGEGGGGGRGCPDNEVSVV